MPAELGSSARILSGKLDNESVKFVLACLSFLECGSNLECADLSALWYSATCRRSSQLNAIPPPAATRRTLLKAVTSHRTPYGC
jgi:hypothetical protein